MKRFALTLALVVAAAAAAGIVAFRASGDPAVRAALARQDAMAWLRSDFQLTDAQFAAIKKLHDSYSTECERHCNAIQVAVRARAALKYAPQPDGAAIAAADRKVEELRLECESAIAAHVRRCAAEMSPAAGERYLALVLPKIKDFDHIAPPDLGLNGHKH
jgi:Spy/CpxP family protein refolding chaperone